MGRAGALADNGDGLQPDALFRSQGHESLAASREVGAVGRMQEEDSVGVMQQRLDAVVEAVVGGIVTVVAKIFDGVDIAARDQNDRGVETPIEGVRTVDIQLQQCLGETVGGVGMVGVATAGGQSLVIVYISADAAGSQQQGEKEGEDGGQPW